MNIIRSEIFSKYEGVIFGMSTRLSRGVSPEPYLMNTSFKTGDAEANVNANRRIFFESLNIDPSRIALPAQVHGDRTRRVEEPGIYESCDALITKIPRIFLCISVADCLPVCLYDPLTPAVAAIHAGWRGCLAGIVPKAVDMLGLEFGSKPENLIAYIGPGAGVCCYEVGEEIVKDLDLVYVSRPRGEKPRLDMKLMTKNQLLTQGLSQGNIEKSDLCTVCSNGVLHSYRRDGARSGRMMALVGFGA